MDSCKQGRKILITTLVSDLMHLNMKKIKWPHLIGWILHLYSQKYNFRIIVDLITCYIIYCCSKIIKKMAKWQNAFSLFFFISFHFSLSSLPLIYLLLHLTGDWTPLGVQSKFHTWSGPGNQLENPSSIFTLRLHSISSLSSYSYSLLTRTPSFLSSYVSSQHHFLLYFLHSCLTLGGPFNVNSSTLKTSYIPCIAFYLTLIFHCNKVHTETDIKFNDNICCWYLIPCFFFH